jgi:diaminopimelate epimerase
MRFWKYHALGNSYIVLHAPVSPAQVRAICDVNTGIGSDGVLADLDGSQPALRIFNPDGSEAEKSGNGLRIFSRWLCDQGRVARNTPFAISTIVGDVHATVFDGDSVEVAMGRVRVAAPVTLPGLDVTGHPADIGNPHIVLLRDAPTEAEARALGPRIETHVHFPRRTNVQFAHVVDAHTIEIEIWERGAGYTLSSGSSSCAAAAVCASLGLVHSPVTVRTRGGPLSVTLSPALDALLRGPVSFVAEGVWAG